MTPPRWTFEEAITLIPLPGKTYICTGPPHRGRELTPKQLRTCKRKKCPNIGQLVE